MNIQSKIDETFVIHELTPYLFAIEEPSYYQGNFSYLIVGNDAALMFDAGANWQKDITQIIKKITSKRLMVLPSHLHFDHIGGLKYFENILLPDLACIRKFENDHGEYHIPDAFHHGSIDGFIPPNIQPTKLIQVNEVIDLGGIQLKVIHAPGHSEDSIVLYDFEHHILLLGDVLYPNELYVGHVEDYEKSLNLLKKYIHQDTRLYGAHPFTTSHVPQISLDDLEQTLKVLQAIRSGQAEVYTDVIEPSLVGSGKRHCVNRRICIYTDIIFKNGNDFSYDH